MKNKLDSLQNLMAEQSLHIDNKEKRIVAITAEINETKQARTTAERDLKTAQGESASIECKCDELARMTVREKIKYLVSALPEMADREFAQIALDELRRLEKFIDLILSENATKAI